MRSNIFASLVLLCFSLIILNSCQKKASTIERARPHDPFVFRSVLDLQPRMITLALHNNLWAAYSAANGQLYKAWKGAVHFDGAVFTYAHGPQPLTMGDAYFINTTPRAWELKSSNSVLPYTYKYRGHRVMNSKAFILHQLNTAQGNIMIDEEVDYSLSESGQIGFERIFHVVDNPGNIDITFLTNASSLIVEQHIQTDGDFTILESTPRKHDKIEVLDIKASLTLNKTGKTRLNLILTDKALIPNPNSPEEFKLDDASTPLGARLIAANHCRTCHNIEKYTVGPSYRAVAQRYEDSESNVKMLANKVKNGGSGVWGQSAMTPHPEISDNELDVMIRYILDLDDPVKKDDKKTASALSFDNVSLEEKELITGALVRVYSISPQVREVKTVDFTKLSPMMAGIMPNFDNMSNADFAGLSEWFALTAEGYFYADEVGVYEFEIWSDDASLLELHNTLIADNDGQHGAEVVSASARLTKGYHPFRIRYQQGGGGAFLSFNYRKEGEENWKVIPQELIFHKIADHHLIGDLSLPMATTMRIPGHQTPLDNVHPSFDLSTARPAGFKPKVGGMDLLSDGRLVVSTWDAEGAVYILDNLASGDSTKITSKKIASGLAEPLGLKVVDDQIYIMQKHELTHLIDLNNDEIIDEYRTVADSWQVSPNFHEFGFGLEYLDGHFYAALATAIEPGGASTQPQIPDRGKVIKVNRETGELSFIAHGLRTPNGIGIGLDNQLFIADNQGDWLPSSKIVHVSEGAWYGSRSVDFIGTAGLREKLPVVWLPQDEIGNSPSTPIGIEVGPYKNQLIHGEVTNGGIKRVFPEKIEGEWQGALFRFTQGLEGGVNRIVWNPDGALYVGGIGNPGNWSHAGKKWYGLERLKYNGKTTFEMLAVRARSNGLQIEFTEPLALGEGWNPSDYEIEQWYYLPTIEYGGPKLGQQRLKVRNVNISEDRRAVDITIDGIKPNHVVYLHLGSGIISQSGNQLWSSECWYTMNRIPKNLPVTESTKSFVAIDNTLTEFEKQAGFQLLFNGKDLNEWHTYNQSGVTPGWKIDGTSFYLDPTVKAGGDLTSNKSYKNFELKLDWKIQNCGNSGIMWNVVESPDYSAPYLTGPEMQILDNVCHPDTRYPTHRAGDLYDMIETKYKTVKPAGQWNNIRIISRDGYVEFWQNGHRVVTFTMHSPEWDELVAKSKFHDWPAFGKAKEGKIVLQDHSDKVWFKNVKIREL